MKDAEANAEADKKRKEEVDLRNEVDQAILRLKRPLRKLAKASTQNATLLKLPMMNLRKPKKTTTTTRKQNSKLLTKD